MKLYPRALAVLAGAALVAGGLVGAQPATAAPSTTTYTSTDPDVAIPDPTLNSAGQEVPGAPVSQTITVSGAQTSLDHLAVGVTLDHPWAYDVTLTITSPDNTTATLVRYAFSAADYAGRYVFTDTASQTVDAAARSLNGLGVIPPGDYLAGEGDSGGAATQQVVLDDVFNGTDPNGTWTLTAQDYQGGDTGTLQDFDLTITADDAPDPDPGPQPQPQPQLIVDGGPADGATVTEAPTYSFYSTESGEKECRVDAGPWETCKSPYTVDIDGLEDGTHTVSFRAIGAGGTSETVSRTFVLDTEPETPPDTTGPTVTITSGPTDGATVDAAPSFGFTSADADLARFECAVDDAEPATCTSAFQTDVEPGPHTFTVQGVDATGNTGTAVSRSFTLRDVACDDATAALAAAQADVDRFKGKVQRRKQALVRARESGNQARIERARDRLTAARGQLAEARDAKAAAQAQVDQDC